MKAIRIHALSGAPTPALDFDLRDILATLGANAEDAVWDVRAVEGQEEYGLDATGSAASELEHLAQTGTRISGKQFLGLAKAIRQVIWGEFRGYETATSADPWIVVTAFDSTWFEVRSTDEPTLARLRNAFKDVRSVSTPSSRRAR
jgi:hypothetical protein